ncbi:MAG TPA: hypothetical protein VLJ84_10915 [Usitatibacter sp.]|nr:hypothetical protein [Usitatibacter sp.]
MPEAAKLPHEASRVSIPALAAGLCVIVAAIAISLVGGWFLLASTGTPANAPNNAVRPAIDGPVQETDAPDTLAKYRREEAAKRDGIEQAMRQLAGGKER